jgi:hypothetical protein
MPYRVGVDIGGTFTDLCLFNEEALVAVGKVLTTPDDPSRAVESVLQQALGRARVRLDQVSQIVHGTTLVTNAILERKGAATALLTTSGFRDVIEIARERRYELYDLMVEQPRPLAPRWLRFDVPERRVSGNRRADVDHALVLDGHEGRTDAHDHRLGVAEELVCDLLRSSFVCDLDADLPDRSRSEARLAELSQQPIPIRNPRRLDLGPHVHPLCGRHLPNR